MSTITEKKIGEIDSIYVDHNLRRSGMGRKLIQRAMNWMNKNGVARKRVYVMVMNEPARTLYEAFGFVPRQLELVTLPGRDTTSQDRQPD